MKLDVYRSCSRQEKQEVLNAFWHRNVQPSSRIHRAAYQYGPYAVLCLVAVALELALVIAVTIHRALVVGSIAIVIEALVMLSLWWAIVRWRAVKAPSG
jgi:uncharacterized membrane protein YhaH (DUF805 family)